MVVDCGGGTVDVTVEQIASTEPLALKEGVPASGGPWGATSVDERFRDMMAALFSPQYWHHVDQRSLLTIMSTWEVEKRAVGRDAAAAATAGAAGAGAGAGTGAGAGAGGSAAGTAGSGFLTIDIGDALYTLEDKGIGFVKSTMGELVSKFNTSFLAGKEPLRFQASSRKLIVPESVVRDFLFMPIISSIVGHLRKLLSTSSPHVDVMVVAGGFADSPLLSSVRRISPHPHCHASATQRQSLRTMAPAGAAAGVLIAYSSCHPPPPTR